MYIIMVALWNRADYYIFMLWFVLLLLSFFSSPNLSRRMQIGCLPYFHTWCGQCEFKTQVWNLLHAARWKHSRPTQKSRQKSPPGHHRTTLSGYIFATKVRIDNRKKNLLNSNMSPTCPHNMVNFGLLPTGGLDRLTSLGYPCKFQLWFRVF